MNFSFRPIGYFFFSFLVLAMLWFQSWQAPVQAVEVAAGLSDPRLARLEFKVNALQSQVNRLQSQLVQNGSISSGVIESSPTFEPPSDSSVANGEFSTDLSLVEQFDNLATLVIEMNQRLGSVERQLLDVSQAEQ